MSEMHRAGAWIRKAWQRSTGRLLTVALVLTSTAYAVAENVTLTTYYPSPRGVYEELRLAADTVANMFQATTTSNANNVRIALQRARVAGGVPDNVLAGDNLGAIRWEGLDTGDNPATDFVVGAQLRADVDGAPAADDMPTRLTFSTDPAGATGLTERMRITSGGNVGIGGIVPIDMLDVAGALRVRGDRIRNNTGLALLQTNAGDWLRINPDSQYPGIAMYTPVAIGTGGLAVGNWTLQAAGVIHAANEINACGGGACSHLRWTGNNSNYLRGNTYFNAPLYDENNAGYYLDPDQTSRMNAVHGNDFLIQNYPGAPRWASALGPRLRWSGGWRVIDDTAGTTTNPAVTSGDVYTTRATGFWYSASAIVNISCAAGDIPLSGVGGCWGDARNGASWHDAWSFTASGTDYWCTVRCTLNPSPPPTGACQAMAYMTCLRP